MKIKMLKTASGPHGAFFVGREYDVPEREAAPLVAAQAAEAVVEPRPAETSPPPEREPAETTSGQPPENAALPQPVKGPGSGAPKTGSSRRPK